MTDRSDANRERLERLRHPERYADQAEREPVTVRPATLEQRVTRRAPMIDPQRKARLQRLERPPRSVSLGLWLRTVLGGWIQQFGWLFFGFGMVFFWAFGMQADVGWGLLAGETATVQGQVTDWRKTASSENETSVYETRYRFELDGQAYTGRSYATGRYESDGSRVTVEYAINDPQRSRIQGMRSKQFSAMALFVIIFPAIGLVFVLAGLRYGLRAARLLKVGEVAFGKLVNKTATNTRINEQTVWKLEFEFQTISGRRGLAEARSHVPASLEDEAEEPLLYDRDDPTKAVMLDGVPGNPEVTADRRLVLGSASGLLMVVALPALSLAGHGGWLYFLLQ